MYNGIIHYECISSLYESISFYLENFNNVAYPLSYFYTVDFRDKVLMILGHKRLLVIRLVGRYHVINFMEYILFIPLLFYCIVVFKVIGLQSC